MDVIRRNNVKILGHGKEVVIFSHGFGCDQNVWQKMIPLFAEKYQVILLDLVGSGSSDLTVYDRVKYGTLHGYADDIIDMCKSLDIEKPIFIGHSVSASIGALVAIKKPDLLKKLVMVAPSPCFINDQDYHGGYDRSTMNNVIKMLEGNFEDWAKLMAPIVMGQMNKPELAQGLFQSFCATRPELAKHFGQVTFLSDHRSEMAKIPVPTLILQCSEDSLAPLTVGNYLKQTVPENQLIQLKATGHCPHLSAPEETTKAVQAWLDAEISKVS